MAVGLCWQGDLPWEAGWGDIWMYCLFRKYALCMHAVAGAGSAAGGKAWALGTLKKNEGDQGPQIHSEMDNYKWH